MTDNKEQLLQIFNTIPFFDDFTQEEKEEVASLQSAVINYYPGEYILHQGDLDAYVLVLLKGHVRVTKKENPIKVIATLNPGAVFGEIAFLNQSPRITNVIADGDAFVLKLNGEMIEGLNHKLQLKISRNFTKILARRLDAFNNVISKHAR